MKKVTDSGNFNGKKYEVSIVIMLITLSMDIQFKNFFFFLLYHEYYVYYKSPQQVAQKKLNCRDRENQ